MKKQTIVNPPLKLDKVIGLTSVHNACFVTSSHGDIFYSAGCFIVRYSVEENRQKGFYKANKTISCISLTEDCKYLAISEKGNISITTIWNSDRYEKLVTLSGHKYGIGCQAFSPNGRYLVTIGFKFDKQLILWDWRSNNKLSIQKLSNKVNAISFHNSGDFFVTAGDRHLKWWNIIEVLEGEAVSLEGKAASILEEQRNSIFMDVICGYESCDTSLFCTTSTGVLCLFNESKMVEKWVQLESSSSYCMELICDSTSTNSNNSDKLFIGCANGTIRCFSPLTLQYLVTFPFPAQLNIPSSLIATANTTINTKENEYDRLQLLYPACFCMRKVPGSQHNPIPKIATIYADRGLYVWDITDIHAISKYRSFIFHRACIWDVRFIDEVNATITSSSSDVAVDLQTSLPKGSFVTCAADNTIKFWNVNPKLQQLSKFKSIYSKELLHSIDLSDNNSKGTNNLSNLNTTQSVIASISATQHLTQESNNIQDIDLVKGIPDMEMPDRIQSKHSPRTIAIHPYGHQLAVGDKVGRLKIFDLSTMHQIVNTQAHAAEILTLSYSPVMVSIDKGKSWFVKGDTDVSQKTNNDSNDDTHSEVVLLASAGRDRLIHLFDASKPFEYTPLETLDQHTSSVTTVQFTTDGKRFLSCGGDRTMVFSSVHGPIISKLKSVPTPHGTVNGLAIEASNKFAITSGQDKRLNIWNLQTGKHMRAYKSDNVNAELYKSDIDPSGMYIATCAFDKTISIFDFFSGELISQGCHTYCISYCIVNNISGHSELITGVKFSPDGRSLISIGGDGCIMIWKVADYLVKAMHDRLVELMSNAQKKNMKADAAVRKSLLLSSEAASDSNVNSILPPPPPTELEENNHNKNNNKLSDNNKNRWITKDNNKDGYELFGKKIRPTATPEANRNKFTLELSSSVHISPNHNNNGNNNNNVISENHLVNALEATDHVILSGLSDDDEDKDNESDEENLFKPLKGTIEEAKEDVKVVDGSVSLSVDHTYEDDFEDPSTNEDAAEQYGIVIALVDPDLEKTQHTIEGLEKSANDLENWLENMIRSENMLDESISTVINEASRVSKSVNDVNILGNTTDDSDALNTTSTITSNTFNQIEKKIHHRKVVDKLTGDISIRPINMNISPSSTNVSLLQDNNNPNNNNNNNNNNNALENHPLDKSLSTSFFENLRKSKDTNTKLPIHRTAILEDRGDNLLPPPPPPSTTQIKSEFRASSTTTTVTVPVPVVAVLQQQQEKERKQRETAATVALMRERLRSMGINTTKVSTTTTTTSDTTKNNNISNLQTIEVHDKDDNQVIDSKIINNTTNNNDDENGYDTESTISEEQHQLSSKYNDTLNDPQNDDTTPIINIPTSHQSSNQFKFNNNNNNNNNNNSLLLKTLEIAAELKRKSIHHQQIVRELEEAKIRAAISYQELSEYRACINHSIICASSDSIISNNEEHNLNTTNSNKATTSYIDYIQQQQLSDKTKTSSNEILEDIEKYSNTSIILSNSIAEVDKLLQDSILSFSDINHNQMSINTTINTKTSSYIIDNNINDVLERYSDKLLEIISTKLSNK